MSPLRKKARKSSSAERVHSSRRVRKARHLTRQEIRSLLLVEARAKAHYRAFRIYCEYDGDQKRVPIWED